MKKTKKNTKTPTKTFTSTSKSISKSAIIIKTPSFFIGCHASIANGILDSIKYVESIGGNALQIFMGSKLQSSLKYKHKFKDQKEINTIREYVSRNKICFLIALRGLQPLELPCF